MNYNHRLNSRGDVVNLYRGDGTIKTHYEYDSWGRVLSVTDENGNPITSANNIGLVNPIRYRGYYYDAETGLYYLKSRYYDPELGRFLNADGQLNDDILGANLFAYCSNNPINRFDDSGRGWWIAIGALVGGVAGGITKAISNVATGRKWNEGIVGAIVGGAVYGGVLAATGNVAAAGFAGAAAEAVTNEVLSYTAIAHINGTKQKQVNKKNIVNSVKTVVKDTAINGSISTVTGKAASKIAPTNRGWFEPQKLTSCIVGKYAVKSELQTLTQSGLMFGSEVVKASLNQRLNNNQKPTITFFPDTEIKAW